MKIKIPKDKHIFFIAGLIILITLTFVLYQTKINDLNNKMSSLLSLKDRNLTDLQNIKQELEDLKNQDQLKINNDLQKEIMDIEKTYDAAVSVYENIIDLKNKTNKTNEIDDLFSKTLKQLSDRNYASASANLSIISQKITDEEKKLASSFLIPDNIIQSNTPPGSGYTRQKVNSPAGTFMVSLIAGDLSNTKVIVDTASDSDCSDNCPVLPLADYVSRNGAYAGINGSYFCPSTYPTCIGKTNSFDLLIMNKNKTYFNSGNNVYSSNPAVIFADSYVRFVSSASQWGRDTSPNGVLSNYPLLVFNSAVAFSGDDDAKKSSAGNRSFVAGKGNTVYIGVVHNATVAQSAQVLHAMGVENALNLDNGGSTALYSGGYKVGPGRNLPNVILFVRK